ncbi:MAG: primosomal protein N' [Myxococcota bacterium]
MSEPVPQEFVDVALPVPLRRTFTYRVPEGDSALPLGCRVAVPFHGRKLAGVVIGRREEPPEGVKRVFRVAGRLEAEPVFPAELLAFLEEAARYYLHPIGEVLRAAAPALPTGAFKRLREEGFLAEGEALPGRRIATRRELFVRAVPEAPEARLGSKQTKVLELVRQAEEIALAALRAEVGSSARGVVRRLEERGFVTTDERDVFVDPFFREPIERDTPPELRPAQGLAVDRMVTSLDDGGAFLLHGVTGSGKTEVYLRVIEAAAKRGRGALLLVPEIALTPQLVARFRARFGDAIAVLHSGLTEREREDHWRALRNGQLRLAVGARSALFAPVPDLGVIVVDEEHDPSFKQEEGFRYHARDMALLRAHRAGALCILGSATPSVESFRRAEGGQLHLLSLPERATSHELPKVEVIDLRRQRAAGTDHPLLTGPLKRAIRDCLDAGDQAILFLNRRGYSPSVRCGDCGAIVECPACSVALTEHRSAAELRCHYCDFRRGFPERCPTCDSTNLDALGLGTEQLEAVLAETFAPAVVARLDRDTASGKGAEQILDRLRRREVDLLVGTQMVTKGHDLPGVTLVGVLLADQSLAFPDFRAGERTFQLLAQVAGRAGRGDRKGRVLFQTFQPQHSAIAAAATHDYEAFYAVEKAEREELAYPPFGRMIAVRVDAGDETRAKDTAESLAHIARAHPAVHEGVLLVQGPAPAPIARLRGRYRFRFLVRGPRVVLRQVARAVAAQIDKGVSPARASVDVDPSSML